MEKKFTVRTLQEMKRRGEKAVMLTAFDAATARWAQEAGVHMLLVGDSMGNTVLGYSNTIPVTHTLTLPGTDRTAHVCIFVSPSLILSPLRPQHLRLRSFRTTALLFVQYITLTICDF